MSTVERLIGGMVRLCITIPEPQYNFLTRWARLKGSTIERVLHESTLGASAIAQDVFDHMIFKTVRARRDTVELLDLAYSRGEIKVKPDPEEVRRTLGELMSVLWEVYCDVPPSIDVTRLSREELSKLSEAIADVTGKAEDPIVYLRRMAEKIEPWGKAFSIHVEREKNQVKGLRFENRFLLATYPYPPEILARMPPKPLTCLYRRS